MVKSFWKDTTHISLHFSTPHVEPKTDQNTDTSNVRHGEPLLVLGLCTEIWVRDEIKITEVRKKSPEAKKNGIIYVKEGWLVTSQS